MQDAKVQYKLKTMVEIRKEAHAEAMEVFASVIVVTIGIGA